MMSDGQPLRAELLAVWERHRDAGWPTGLGSNEGELMTLDTVISGCMVYLLDTPEGLDQPRVAILEGCLDDLDQLMPDLSEECTPYVSRLRTLASLLIDTTKH